MISFEQALSKLLSLAEYLDVEEVKLEEGKDRFSYNIRSVLSDYEKFRIEKQETLLTVCAQSNFYSYGNQ